MMRLTGGATVLAVMVVLAPVAALAQTPGLVNARVEISAAVAGSSATQEAIERQANARDRARQQEIAALQAQLVEALTKGASEVARLETALTDAREALVTDLAARDPAYAEVIALFRREVADIASTPAGAAALAQFNRGEEVEALELFDRIIEANDRARQLATEGAVRALQAISDREAAAQRRSAAVLALDARNRGRLSAEAVIARFERVTQLDSGTFGDWKELVLLYSDVGQSAKAAAATERMYALADTDQKKALARLRRAEIRLVQGDRAGATADYQYSLAINERLFAESQDSIEIGQDLNRTLNRFGDLFIGQGDKENALIYYRRSLDLARRLSASQPDSVLLAGNVGIALSRIGDVLRSQNDPVGALQFYRDRLAIAERLAIADPSSVDFRLDLGLTQLSVGDALMDQRDIEGAIARFQLALEIFERLSASDSSSTDRGRVVGMAHERLGDALSHRGDLEGALQRYRQSLEITERLAAGDPSSMDLARNVGVSLTRIADVLLNQGNAEEAAIHYRRSLELSERLYAADPASVLLARDVVYLAWRLGVLSGETRYSERARAILRDRDARGTLEDSERTFLAELEAVLSGRGSSSN